MLVSPGDRDEAGQPHLSVARRELCLAPNRRLVRLPLARRLGLAEPPSQLAVSPVPRDRGLDLPRRAIR